MRLFPVLVAVVVVAIPLSECKNANAQTADSLKQTTFLMAKIMILRPLKQGKRMAIAPVSSV
ncbi:hypothetical protein [Fortiea contorta]|uniref:hypothetical protein n=1 Tax=Fortiea contorta TaxID=1892405 RepID=UPI00034809DC|nr:hypothetical protein [Fortiea contorta]